MPSFISNFIQSFKSDELFRKRAIFVGLSVVLIIVIIIGFIALNTNKAKSEIKPNVTQTTNQSTIEPENPKIVVTTQNLNDSKEFSQVGVETVGYPDSLLVSNDKLSFINFKSYFTNDDKPVITPSLYTPAKLLDSPDGIIINESNSSSYFAKDGKIKSFSGTPLQVLSSFSKTSNSLQTSYYSIQNNNIENNKELQVFQSTKIDLSDNQLFAKLTSLNDKNYKQTDLQYISNSLYLFGYEKTDRTGKVDIYLVEKDKVTFKKEILEVRGLKIGTNQIFYLQSLREAGQPLSSKLGVMDFTTPKYDVSLLEVKQSVVTDGILGPFNIDRCRFAQNNQSFIYCLIKKQASFGNQPSEPDIIVKIDWKTDKYSYILKDSVFSASSIFVVDDKNIYFVGQESKKVYKLNNVDSQ
jgi:hypothetical protein